MTKASSPAGRSASRRRASRIIRPGRRSRRAPPRAPASLSLSAGRPPLEGTSAAAPEALPDPKALPDPEALPDIDTLEAGSDFTPFLKDGVPQTLKQRALRKLWQVDPAFKEICMLDDYNLDYTDAATVVPNLKTLYQVGRGMVLPEAEPEEDAAEEAVAAQEGAQESIEGGALEDPQEGAGDRAAALSDESGAAQAGPEGEAEPEPLPESQPDAVSPRPARPAPRKPGTPRVAAGAPANRRTDSSRPAARSARQRRWGDPET